MRKKISILLIIIGVAIIASALFMRLSADRKQQALINDFEKTIENIDKTNDSQAIKTSNGNVANVIGEIIIPKIDLKVAVSEGVDVETLKYAVGHFKGTAMPGEKGNFCVAGHRSYTYGEYFNRLDELQVGDKITVKGNNGEYSYSIYEKKVVEPTEVSVLNKTEESIITLVTCTPIRSATHRLIIKGKLE